MWKNIDQTMMNFIADTSTMYFDRKHGLCKEFLSEGTDGPSIFKFGGTEKVGHSCPVVEFFSDASPRTEKALLEKDGEEHHQSYVLQHQTDEIMGKDKLSWRSIRYQGEGSSKVFDIATSCDKEDITGQLFVPITALGVYFTGDTKLDHLKLLEEMNSPEESEPESTAAAHAFPRTRKYNPVWELTEQGALRDKIWKPDPGTATNNGHLHLCGRDQCVDYMKYYDDNGAEKKFMTDTSGIQTATFSKRSGLTRFEKFGTFVLNRGTGAPIKKIDVCPVSSKKF